MNSREEDALQALVLPKSLAVKGCPEDQGKNKAGFQALMELQVYLLLSQDFYAARHNGALGTAGFTEEVDPSVLGCAGAPSWFMGRKNTYSIFTNFLKSSCKKIF